MSTSHLGLLDQIQYRILWWISPQDPPYMSGQAYAGKTKIKVLLGAELFDQLKGQVVLDFGCGEGEEAIALAQDAASKVIGLDIRPSLLERARAKASAQGLADVCEFCTHTDEQVDAIVSIDSFEHFEDPAAVLNTMRKLLKPEGAVYVSFGPCWYHPLGGHLFSVFPWAHILFSEKALLRWRSNLRNDGATRFGEVEGGLNQMTVSRFERIISASPFRIEKFETVPIRKLRLLFNRVTREFTTSIVRCKLVPKTRIPSFHPPAVV
jgi:SAM-dependent methyltransferase